MLIETEKTVYTRGELALLVCDNISAMLAYWDKNKLCRFANAAYLEWFGKSKEEMIDKMTIDQLLGPLYQLNLPYITGALEGKRQTFEREIPVPSGGIRYSIANYYPDLVNGEVKGFVVHVADITPVKLLEKELIRLKQLEAKNKELEQFTYIASHDLQEPLRTIRNIVDVVSKDYGPILDSALRKYLAVIDKSTARMSTLIKAVLDYSRIGRDKKIVPVDTKKIVNDVIGDLKKSIYGSKAVIHIGELPELRAYESELHLVFHNLLSNAIKFCKKDIAPEIWIDARKKNDLWEFSIKDNGIGIEKKYSEKIFNIFSRLHPEFEYPGKGIGLAVCKKIIELHGGKDLGRIRSGKRKYILFYNFELTRVNRKINCIMLVDDNEYDNFFHERTIREYDSAVSVITKRSATEALEFINTKLSKHEKLPDLLLLDINMPGMNGWDFLYEYEKLNNSLDEKMCIVILTTSSNPDDEIRAKTFSIVSGFITKPLTKEILNEIIDKYLVPVE